MLRDGSRNTSNHTFHDGSASSGASNSFAIQAENRSSLARFQLLRSGQTLAAVARSPAGLRAATVMLRVTLPQPSVSWSSASVACQVPAAGVATSAYQ